MVKSSCKVTHSHRKKQYLLPAIDRTDGIALEAMLAEPAGTTLPEEKGISRARKLRVKGRRPVTSYSPGIYTRGPIATQASSREEN